MTLLGRLLVLFALWMQVLAPVTALQAMRTAGDPLAGMVLCTGHGAEASPAPDEHRTDHPARPCAACALCCASLAVLDAAPPRAAAVAFTFARLAFAPAPEGLPVASGPDHPRARDPPRLV